MRFRPIIVPAVAALGVISCLDLPTEPGGTSRELLAGRTARASLSPGEVVYMPLRGPVPVGHRVYVWLDGAGAADTVDVAYVRVFANAEPFVWAEGQVAGDDPEGARWVHVTAIPQPSDQVIRLSLRGSTGTRRVLLRSELPDAAPESATALLVVDDTVHETLSGFDDTDEFRVTGIANRRQLLYFGRERGPVDHPMAITVRDAAGAIVTEYVIDEANVAIGSQVIPIEVPAGVQYRVTVSAPTPFASPMGVAADGPLDRYRLHWVSLPLAPELAPTTLVYGDTTEETLSRLADEDLFTFTETAGQPYAVAVRLLDAVSDTLRVTLEPFEDADPVILLLTDSSADLESTVTRRMDPTSTRTRTLRVRGPARSGTLSASAAYRVELRRINPAPEVASAALTLGVTVMGEDIGRRRDSDTYTITIPPNTAFAFESEGNVRAALRYPVDLRSTYDPEWRDLHDEEVGERRASRRYASLTGGTFTIAIRERDVVPAPYTFRLHVVDPAPEEGSAVLTPGEWRRGTIDQAGDVDTYTHLPLRDGYVAGFLRSVPGREGNVVAAFNNGTLLFQGAGSGRQATPAGQTVTIKVDGTTLAPADGRVQYELMIIEIDTLPEMHPEAIALGDTVVESIDPREDVDTFMLPLTAGQTIRISWPSTPPCGEGGPHFDVAIFENGTLRHRSYSPGLINPPEGSFVAAHTGIAAVQVRSFENCGAAMYRLLLESSVP